MSKKYNLIGQKFGKLTVVQSTHDSMGRFAWLCECDCGGTRIVKTSELRSGRVVTCGCSRKMIDHINAEDLVGERFGQLMVVAKNGNGRFNSTKWLCQCDCGNKIIVPAAKLMRRNHSVKSCGHDFRQCLKGLRFGKLLVKEQSFTSKQGIMWLCICECGNIRLATTGQLNSNRVTKCEVHNDIILENGYLRIIDNHGRSFLCSCEDIEIARKYYWSVDPSSKRPRSIINGHQIRFYRLVMNAPDNKVVDHINGDPSDNRRENLRLASNVENSWNKRSSNSSVRGVNYRPEQTKHPWIAVLSFGGNTYRKSFRTQEEAIEQRKLWEREFYGEFSPLNEISEEK